MATPVEVSYIKRTGVEHSVIEGLGGIWRDRPWYMSERSVVWEIGRPRTSANGISSSSSTVSTAGRRAAPLDRRLRLATLRPAVLQIMGERVEARCCHIRILLNVPICVE